MVELLRHIHADDFGIARLDDLPRPIPLPVVVGLFEREEAVVIEPADGQMLHALVAAGIEEHEDVRWREEYVVSGAMDRNTGSSLYSRDTITHVSMPSRRISAGSSVLKRCSIQRDRSGGCSRCVRTRLDGRD